MTDIRKDHSIGTAGGAVAGAVAGAAVGVVGGPIGMAAGAVVGSVLGAGAGDSLAELVNPTEYSDHWRTVYQSTPYYAQGREWTDYEPAYSLGYSAFDTSAGRSFEQIESELQGRWQATRGASQLEWEDAKPAVQAGWHYVERGKALKS